MPFERPKRKERMYQMLDIEIKSRHLQYKLTLQTKLTIIRGMSGVGKTTFRDLAGSTAKNVKKEISDPAYDFVVVQNNRWAEEIEDNLERKKIFIIDDLGVCCFKLFAELIKRDKNNFYIIVTRDEDCWGTNLLPIELSSIMQMRTSGKCHWLEPWYTYSNIPIKQGVMLITEDKKSGYRFFKSLNANVISSDGKDKCIDLISTYKRDALLLVDTAALGGIFDMLLEAADAAKVTLYICSSYKSFEYMLLRSHMFDLDFNTLPNNILCSEISLERVATRILREETKGTPYSYTKSGNVDCFIKDCCPKRLTSACDKRNVGDKISFLFKDTEFESLISYICGRKL